MEPKPVNIEVIGVVVCSDSPTFSVRVMLVTDSIKVVTQQGMQKDVKMSPDQVSGGDIIHNAILVHHNLPNKLT